jgi:hypothetical protein
MDHWEDKHAKAAYKVAEYKCSDCELGFVSKDMYATHLERSCGDETTHDNGRTKFLNSKGLGYHYLFSVCSLPVCKDMSRV